MFLCLSGHQNLQFNLRILFCVEIISQICIEYNSKWWIPLIEAETNGCHFADDIFNSIFVTQNVWTPIKISLKFVPKGLINDILALVQIMAWHRPGDKSLSEPMMVSLLTHICVTRSQWVLIYWYTVMVKNNPVKTSLFSSQLSRKHLQLIWIYVLIYCNCASDYGAWHIVYSHTTFIVKYDMIFHTSL